MRHILSAHTLRPSERPGVPAAAWLVAGMAAAAIAVSIAGTATVSWAQPARPDTTVGLVSVSPGFPPILSIHVRPDTVVFGGLLQMAVDFDGQAPPDSALTVQTPWLASTAPARRGWLDLRPRRDTGEGLAPWPAAAAGAGRLVRAFRVYGTDPFRLQADAAISAVVAVKGRTGGVGQAAPIRDPRPLGLALAAWVWALLTAAAAALLIWRLRRRRKRVAAEDLDMPLSPIAWLAAVRDLRQLVAEEGSGGREGRRFLDQLTGIVRTYIGGRYLIGAREMTGREIVAACRSRGYPLDPVRGLAGLVDENDRRRYGPGEPEPKDCREAAARFLVLMGQVRILPRFTSVPPDEVRSGQAAWDSLAREFEKTGTEASAQAPVGGVR